MPAVRNRAKALRPARKAKVSKVDQRRNNEESILRVLKRLVGRKPAARSCRHTGMDGHCNSMMLITAAAKTTSMADFGKYMQNCLIDETRVGGCMWKHELPPQLTLERLVNDPTLVPLLLRREELKPIPKSSATIYSPASSTTTKAKATSTRIIKSPNKPTTTVAPAPLVMETPAMYEAMPLVSIPGHTDWGMPASDFLDRSAPVEVVIDLQPHYDDITLILAAQKSTGRFCLNDHRPVLGVFGVEYQQNLLHFFNKEWHPGNFGSEWNYVAGLSIRIKVVDDIYTT